MRMRDLEKMEDAHARPPLRTPNAIPYKEREGDTATQGRTHMHLALPVKSPSAHDQIWQPIKAGNHVELLLLCCRRSGGHTDMPAWWAAMPITSWPCCTWLQVFTTNSTAQLMQYGIAAPCWHSARYLCRAKPQETSTSLVSLYSSKLFHP